MNIYPYSFAEYLIANGKEKNYLDTISTNDKAELLAQYNEYVTYGAFPELVEIKNKRTFLSSIYLTVYLGDIITRNKKNNIKMYKNIIFDMDSYRVYKDDQEIILTGLELKLLFFLLENNGIIVTRDMIIDKIWDVSGKFVNDNTLSVYIKRIREKIGCEDIIKTIKGIGYRIDL